MYRLVNDVFEHMTISYLHEVCTFINFKLQENHARYSHGVKLFAYIGK